MIISTVGKYKNNFHHPVNTFNLLADNVSAQLEQAKTLSSSKISVHYFIDQRMKEYSIRNYCLVLTKMKNTAANKNYSFEEKEHLDIKLQGLTQGCAKD